MPFNKKYYKVIKKYNDRQILHIPWCSRTTTAEEHAQMYEKLMMDCVEAEDYEAAQAVKHSISDFLDKYKGTVFISKMPVK